MASEKDSKPASAEAPEQVSLFDVGAAWENEWTGMPEFVQKDLEPVKSIYVHFETWADMEAFAKLVDQKVGADTWSIWFPEAEIGRYANKKYVVPEPAPEEAPDPDEDESVPPMERFSGDDAFPPDED